MKKFLAIVLSLVAAWIAMEVFWWIISNAFSLMFSLAKVAVLALIAIPIYILISRRLR